VELRHLRYFVAVAGEEHMTRAASRLAIQQPPLSQQIQALEQELGVQLFDRRPRSIRLNAAGKLFLSDARKVLANVDAAVQRVRRFDLGEEGRIRVGFTSSASLHQLTPRIVRAFRTSYPLMFLEIGEGTTHDLLHAVEQERLDIAFVRSPLPANSSLESVTLVRENMVVALPSNHRLAQEPRQGIALAALKDEDFILFHPLNGWGIKDMLMEVCQRNGFAPRAVEEVPRLIAAIHLVAAGLGISIVPQSMRSIQPDCVVYRPLDPPTAFTVPLELAHRRNVDAEGIRRFLAMSLQLAQADTARDPAQ